MTKNLIEDTADVSKLKRTHKLLIGGVIVAAAVGSLSLFSGSSVGANLFDGSFDEADGSFDEADGSFDEADGSFDEVGLTVESGGVSGVAPGTNGAGNVAEPQVPEVAEEEVAAQDDPDASQYDTGYNDSEGYHDEGDASEYDTGYNDSEGYYDNRSYDYGSSNSGLTPDDVLRSTDPDDGIDPGDALETYLGQFTVY